MSREERQLRAGLRAQLSLKHSLERIDHDFDVIAPKVAALRERQAELVIDDDREAEAQRMLPMPKGD